ncbi:MAG: universal stress protein [Acetobacterales bacterium]
MDIRTILLPFTSTPGDKAAMELAFVIANKYRSNVHGLHVRMDPRDIAPLAGEGLSGAMIEEMMESAEKEGMEHSSAARRMFDEYCKSKGIPFVEEPPGPGGVSASWHTEIGREEDVVSWHGRLHDIIVISRPAEGQEKSTTEVVHAALMDAGRPLMLAPPEAPSDIGKRVAVAWNGSREAAKSIAAARPILMQADEVYILTAEEGYSHGPGAADVARYLSWYDVRPELRQFGGSSPQDIGGSLLSKLNELGADMLVMGAYTHSRLRHLILGGVTSHVVSNAMMPVFMHR